MFKSWESCKPHCDCGVWTGVDVDVELPVDELSWVLKPAIGKPHEMVGQFYPVDVYRALTRPDDLLPSGVVHELRVGDLLYIHEYIMVRRVIDAHDLSTSGTFILDELPELHLLEVVVRD